MKLVRAMKRTTVMYRVGLGLAAAAACLSLLVTPALANPVAKPASAAPGSPAPVLPSLKGVIGPAIRIKSAARNNSAGIPIQETNNWSGYIAVPKSGGSQTFSAVTAQYTVPSVNCSATGSSDALAGHWVGLDGYSDSTVEQDGVADYCINGSPEYYDWWEMAPAPVHLMYAVDPGDDIQSWVTYNPTTKLYALKLNDITHPAASFSVTEACAGTCDNSSAEVITEGYAASQWVGTADFGAEFYVAITATDGAGVTGSLTNGNWATVEAIAYGANGTFMTAPGQIYEGESIDRSAFVINWNSVN